MPSSAPLADNGRMPYFVDSPQDEIARQIEARWVSRIEALTAAVESERDQRRRAECMAHIQSDVMQRALDLLVTEADISGFFRVFIQTLVEESESHACAVWLLDTDGSQCHLWMAYVQGQFFSKETENWPELALPRASMEAHLLADAAGWKTTVEYEGDDARLPAAVREFNAAVNIGAVVIVPLVLPTRNLGWIALSAAGCSDCEKGWRRALTEAVARQATMALHQNRLSEQRRLEERRQAVLEERNRIARDIHDTLTQGFAAILMQLQAARRSTGALPRTVVRALETAVDLARTHMIEARRSVGALRPHSNEGEDVGGALRRMTDLTRRTTDVPIELTVEELPPLGGGVEREVIGIAQEALTNAVRHARARKIVIHASTVRSLGLRLSIADDGRGIAREHRGTGFGMTSMQERAERIGASLTIVTAPRAGTEVVLAWEPPSFSIPGPEHAAV
jgi:signal transduction histidine kinase